MPHFVWDGVHRDVFPRHVSAEGHLASLGATKKVGSGRQIGG